jgi:hypothetical protein
MILERSRAAINARGAIGQMWKLGRDEFFELAGRSRAATPADMAFVVDVAGFG